MSPLILSFTDGTSFFVGLAVVFAANLSISRFRTGITRRLLATAVLVGVTVVIASAVPLPMWAYALWACASLMPPTLRTRPEYRKTSIASVALSAATTIGLLAWEAPYHRLPQLQVAPNDTVYVVGDSLSAGIGIGERSWPAVLADTTGLNVVNLARAGATVRTALAQASLVTKPGSLVIVEIGGNDLLGGADASTFRRQLDALISVLCSKDSQILMFELPLLPFHNAFGRAQRDIAAEHNVLLLPKGCLSAVFGEKGATLDGLHLTQEGHHALAETVAVVLQRPNSDDDSGRSGARSAADRP